MSYWREIGSGTFSASQIARYRLDEVIEVPLSCRSHFRFIQTEYVENPFYNFKFYPAEGQTIEADCRFNEYFSAVVSATCKTYFGEFKSTITSRNNIQWTVNDQLNILVGCNREDVIYNFFSLKQSIQAIDSYVTAASNLTHNWNLGGMFQYYCYNDHNSQVHVNLTTEYQLTEEPNVFKVILEGNYRNAAKQSETIVVNGQIVDMIHPYWTPDKYISGALTLICRHSYKTFDFCEAPQRYFDLRVTFEADNAHNPSVQGVFEWKHDFDHHWGFDLKGLIHRSPLWNAEGAWATLNYRF